MAELLSYSLLVEPDRQRLSQIVMLAVRALGGNAFEAAAHLNSVLRTLHDAMQHNASKLDVSLTLDERRLCLSWPGERHCINLLTTPADPQLVGELARQLRHESESADPSLLKLRNQEISAELERFMGAAEDKMRDMEETLERKRRELAETLRQAETDSLTGLLNRGAYDDRLAAAVADSQGGGGALSLLLLDLDFFKQINDQHGHQFGDQYLQRMADTLRSALQDCDGLPCRIGGDEFALLCRCTMDEAEQVAQLVLEGMDRRVSIGIARCRPDDSAESLVERADAALYLAKRRGRNRFAREDEMPDEAARA